MSRIVIVGYPMHGKSVFINSLLLLLENIPKISPDFFYEFLDDYTRTFFREMRLEFRRGVLPPATPIRKPEPLRLRIGRLADIKEALLDIFLITGEVLENPDLGEYASDLRNADVVWMLVSLTDLEQTGTDTIADVFLNYQRLVQQFHVLQRPKRMVIVLTKADLFLSTSALALPENVYAYLAEDPYFEIDSRKSRDLPPLDYSAYRTQILDVSRSLERFVIDEVRGGNTLVNLARASSIELDFAISSTWSSSGVKPSFYRVLDTLLLTMSKVNSTTLNDEERGNYASLNPEAVFVSYRRTDWEEYVRPLLDQLARNGIAYWVDQHLIEDGDDWLDEINLALRTCNRMLLCISPEALQSRHVKLEYRYFFNHGKKIYPIVCRETELPAELQTIQYYPYARLAEVVERLKNKS